MVEVLVAVFIITVGLVAVATGMQLATSGVATGQQQTTAAFLAEQRLEDIKAFALSTGSGQGWANVSTTAFPVEAYNSITSYPTYRRSTTVTSPSATTKRITVDVFWFPVGVTQSANAERSVTVSVMLTSRT